MSNNGGEIHRELSIAAFESVNNRRNLGQWLDRVIATDIADPRPILAIGSGLEHLATAASERKIIWLHGADQPVGPLPRLTRAEVWCNPPRIPLADKSVGCVVILDELALIAPSHRKILLREVLRIATEAVLIAGPFDTAEVTAALLRLNDAHQGLSGSGHPPLERALDMGLPNLAETVSLLGTAYPNVLAEPFDSLAAWEQTQLIAALAGENGATANGFEGALTAVDRCPRGPSGPSFRHIVVANMQPLRPPSENHGTSVPQQGRAPMDLVHLLSYVRIARCERQMSGLGDTINQTVTGALDRLSAQSSDMITRVTAERDAMQRDFERLIRNLSDDLQDLEEECTELRRDKERLATEHDAKLSECHAALTNMNAALSDKERLAAEHDARLSECHAALTNANAALRRSEDRAAHLQHVIQVMEATRGWKALLLFRRVRDRVLGRSG